MGVLNMNYRNLVFQGGGVKGLAYLGALKALDENDIIRSIEKVAGASAGAITALITCFNMNYTQIVDMMDSLDFSKIPEKKDEVKLSVSTKKEVESLWGDVDCIHRLMTSYGWYSSNYFYKWLQGVIQSQFKKEVKPPYTFQMFMDSSLHIEEKEFKELHVIGTDMERGGSQIFNYLLTPYVEVAEAVRISMSIPLFFETQSFTYPGELPSIYSDGGTMLNYPINIFDSEVPNRATLGFRTKDISNQEQKKHIDSLIGYIEHLFQALIKTQDNMLENIPGDMARTITIDSCGVKTTDFKIKKGDSQYNLLVEAGYNNTLNFIGG